MPLSLRSLCLPPLFGSRCSWLLLVVLGLLPTSVFAQDLFLFDLDGRYPLEGKIVTRRMVSERPNHLFTYDFPDRSERLTISTTQVLTRHGQTLKEDPRTGEPLDFTVRFTEGEERKILSRLGQRVNDGLEQHPLLGHTVRVRKIGDLWVPSLVDADPTPEQVTAMQELKLDDDAPKVYPEQPVPIGFTWNPPASVFLGKRSANSFNATAELTLKDVERSNGEPIAVIDVKLTGNALQQIDRELSTGMRGSFEMTGQIRRNLRTYMDESVRLEGQMSVSGLFKSPGEGPIPVSAEGPWILTVTETLR
ncbi:MAG: hypothetical protein ACFBZ8_08315 [Opitutales bacterium]